MPDPAAFHANLQRGSLLLNQNRPREALPFIQGAIAANPDAPEAYAELARCYLQIPAQRSKVLGAINRAVGLAPNVSFYFGRKGWFQVCLNDYRGAYRSAQQGLALNPTCPQSLNALANAHTKLNQWKKAETACLRILEQSPQDAAGLNLLAQALSRQGRWKESRETIARILALYPNNSFGHANAGYGALAVGDHRRANEHFLEALRMEPHSDFARRGLLQSLRARIWIIRFNTRITSFAHRPATFINLAATVLGFVGFITAIAYMSQFMNRFYPNAGTIFFGSLFGLLLLYVYLSAIVGLLGTFLLLFDPLGRHALTTREKVRACLPALAYAVAMLWLCFTGGWWIALGLTFFLVLLALSIQFPLLRDRWQRRRES